MDYSNLFTKAILYYPYLVIEWARNCGGPATDEENE
jgi:hypothetical protein